MRIFIEQKTDTRLRFTAMKRIRATPNKLVQVLVHNGEVHTLSPYTERKG